MNRYALIQGGIVANVVEQSSAPTIPGLWVLCAATVGPGDTYGGGIFARPAVVAIRRLTKRAFWNRFPVNNEIAMRAVMKSGAPMILAASLERLQTRVEASPFVDLALAEARTGVEWLGSAAVPVTVTFDGVTLPLRLTAGEVAAVLDGAIVDSERP